MGKSNRTKGIKNRGTQIHEDKKRKYYYKWDDGRDHHMYHVLLEEMKFREELNQLKEEHDDPRNDIPSNAI